jgi:hypothetical protein
MKRSFLVVPATLALAFGVSAPASAAVADPHASCAGLVGPYHASQGPGTHAQVALDVVADAQSHGMPPGATFDGFAHFHDGTAEICLD